MSLQFSSKNTKLTGVATTGGAYVMIIARTDSVITYTETYEDGTTEVFTDEALSAGSVLYGIFSSVSATSGHAVVSR